MSADSIIPDPYNPQSLNRYSYVRNDPVNRIDPTGHMDQIDNIGGGGCSLNNLAACVGNSGGNGGGGNGNGGGGCTTLSCMSGGSSPFVGGVSVNPGTSDNQTVQSMWEWSQNFNWGYNIGSEVNAPMPDYYGGTKNSANVPYFPGGNQDPFTCVGGGVGTLACLISLGASLIPYQYGSANTNYNFFVSYNVYYNETSGVTVSDIYWSNHYDGVATFSSFNIGGRDVPVIEWGYMPTDGNYRPISNSGGWYNGNEPIWTQMVVHTFINTPDGFDPIPHRLKAFIPSLQDMKNHTQR